MEMRMRQLGTPQHPSSSARPQQFRTPQHPSSSSMAAGPNNWDWGGAQSLRFDHFRTPQPQFLRTNDHEYYWDEPFRIPQHTGETYWGTVDGKRQFGTPLSPAAFGKKNHDEDGVNLIGEPRQFSTPQHPAAAQGMMKNRWGTVDGTRQFGTPQHPSAFREFRTPQHPSVGSNNWGGASPLLARNIPQESLDSRYERLHSTLRTHQNVIFAPAAEDDYDDDDNDDFMYSSSRIEPKYGFGSTPNPTPNPNPIPKTRRRGLLWKLIKREPRDKNPKVLGNPSKTKKKKWFPIFDRQKKWPTGW